MADLYDDEILEEDVFFDDEYIDDPLEEEFISEEASIQEEEHRVALPEGTNHMIEILDDDDEADEEVIRALFPERKPSPVVFNKPEEEEDISDDIPVYRKSFEDTEKDESILEGIKAWFKDVTPKGLLKKGLILTLLMTYLIWTSMQNLVSSMFNRGEVSANPFTLTYNMIMHLPVLALVGIILAVLFTLLVGVIYVSVMKKTEGKYKISENNTYGDLREATEEDLEGAIAFTDKARPKDICLGLSKDEKYSLSLDILRGNRNVLVTGSSGSGKDYTFVTTNAMVAIDIGDSVVVLDPAGQTYKLTNKLAQKKGYVVKVLNMKKLDASDGWDMLVPIKKAKGTFNETTEVNAFVTTLMDNATTGKEKGQYFDLIERNLLSCIVSYVALDDDFYGKEYERHIGTVYDILIAIMANGGQFPLFDMLPNSSPAKISWKQFRGGSQGQKESAMTGLAAKLNLIIKEEMLKEIFSHDEIDLSLPGREKCIYYIVTDVTRTTYQPVLSLFFSSLIQTLIDQADEMDGMDDELKNVHVFLNEFKASGVLEGFSDKLSNVRKYKVNLIPIVQDIEQIEKIYPGELNTIMSNCDTLVNLGVNDNKGAKILSEAMGEMTIVNESKRINKPRFNPFFIPLQENVSTSDGKRYFLSAGEIRRLRKDNEILIISNGRYPYIGHPYPYKEHYLSQYVDKPENQSDIRKRVPKWQNEEKTIEKYRTFLDPEIVDVSRNELETKIKREKGFPVKEENNERKAGAQVKNPEKRKVLPRYEDSRTLSSDIFNE